MNSPSTKKHWLALGAMTLMSCAQAATPVATKSEINTLLQTLQTSGCQFNRNGSWHDSKAARDHLQDKYDYLQRRKLVPDTRAFIERAASESSFTHRAYQVRCGNGQPVSSAQWLNAELARYRAGEHQ